MSHLPDTITDKEKQQIVTERMQAHAGVAYAPRTSSELTFAELVEAKRQLEQDLLNRLRNFSSKTGLKVTFIDIEEAGLSYDRVRVEATLP